MQGGIGTPPSRLALGNDLSGDMYDVSDDMHVSTETYQLIWMPAFTLDIYSC
jgi:hypothetical protein